MKVLNKCHLSPLDVFPSSGLGLPFRFMSLCCVNVLAFEGNQNKSKGCSYILFIQVAMSYMDIYIYIIRGSGWGIMISE